MSTAWLRRARAGLAAGGLLACTALHAADAAADPAPTPASAPRPAVHAHVSPYTLARMQHAQEAASAPAKVNPLMQHRPRMPSSMRRG